MLLVFTDLDGTLLDHESYSIEAALPAISNLQERGFPLVMNSSKTATEIENLQIELGLSAPFICENGAALKQLDPSIEKDTSGAKDNSSAKDTSSAKDNSVVFGSFLSEWLTKLHKLRESNGYEFEGFSDWSVQRVSDLTNLQPEAASRAKCRQFSEPILWCDSESKKGQFVEQLKEMGLQLIEGGRFFSVQGIHDKSNAMKWLHKHYTDVADVITLALGDSPNDIAMLNAADVAVVIKSSKSEHIEIQSPRRVIRTTLLGSAGWNEAMQEVLSLYDSGRLIPDAN